MPGPGRAEPHPPPVARRLSLAGGPLHDGAMRARPVPLPTALLVLGVLLPAAPTARAGDDVVIYRCTGADGRLTLRDSPCEKGQRQETRTMLRPKDAPPRPVVAAPAGPQAPTTVTREVIVLNAPRPMYECVTPDDQRYLSDSPEGNPRAVPMWTLGAPLFGRVPVNEPGHVDFQVENGRVSGNYRSGSVGTAIVPTPAAYGATTWVRDACYALPQADVCGRLRDRRGEIGRRYAIAQPSERTALAREERSLVARIDQDCR